MRWQPLWSTCQLTAFCTLWAMLCLPAVMQARGEFMSTAKRHELRQLTKDLWYHAFDSYMEHAYPADELKPLTCSGLSRDGTTNEHEINDVMGGYSLTLIDALDSFVVLGDVQGFEKAVKLVIDHVSFDIDARVQVFEVTIRVLGGLLSAHIHASGGKTMSGISWYTDELLHMAHDLGRRLLPAFQNSLTGLPWARVNLKHGLSQTENVETCTAGAGSLLLEFATLSRLTSDPIFEQVARKALFALWNRRSDINLLGNTLNVQTGAWLSSTASIGAGVDSFYEYLAKAYILLGDDEYYRLWSDSYGAVMKYLRSDDGFWYRGANMNTGQLATVYADSLSHFFPGLQVLMGDVESAIKSHAVFAMLWERYSASPEIFNTQSRRAEAMAWPLRPELVESTYMLYRATKDHSYLSFGERVLYDIANRTRVPCGIAALENVETGLQQDRMHSFVIAETLPDNPINIGVTNSVFTTEGHLLSLDKILLKPAPKSRKGEALYCPRYDPLATVNASLTAGALQTGIPHRRDMEYARALTGLQPNVILAQQSGLWHPNGYCEAPLVEDYVLSLLFSPSDETEDRSPSLEKVEPIPSDNAFIVYSIQGLRIQITRRLDESGGYDVTKIGPYRISSSSTVYMADPAVLTALRPDLVLKRSHLATNEPATLVELHIYSDDGSVTTLQAAKAAFGPQIDALSNASIKAELRDLTHGTNANACHDVTMNAQDQVITPFALIVHRGACTFVEKMRNASAAGASAVIVLNDSDELLVPSADTTELLSVHNPIPMVLLSKGAAKELAGVLTGSAGSARLQLPAKAIPKDALSLEEDLLRTPVVVNGYLLVNCFLLRP